MLFMIAISALLVSVLLVVDARKIDKAHKKENPRYTTAIRVLMAICLSCLGLVYFEGALSGVIDYRLAPAMRLVILALIWAIGAEVISRWHIGR